MIISRVSKKAEKSNIIIAFESTTTNYCIGGKQRMFCTLDKNLEALDEKLERLNKNIKDCQMETKACQKEMKEIKRVIKEIKNKKESI